jgi:ribosome-associated toxin RatA of RatAB toxin-antitoxin module
MTSAAFSRRRWPLWLGLCALAGSTPVWAADAQKPHDHQGVLKPYPRPPPAIVITPDEQAVLNSGKPVMRALGGDGGGRGLAVFLVQAPPAVTWKVINNFAAYPSYIKEVEVCEVYRRDGENADTRFVLSAMGINVEYFINHRVNHAGKWMTWTLDYTRQSDVNDSVGFWRVNEVPGQPNQSQVEYSIDVSLKSWVPGFVRDLMVDNGVKTATTWVSQNSEKRWKRDQEKAAAATPAPAPPATPPAPAAPATTP